MKGQAGYVIFIAVVYFILLGLMAPLVNAIFGDVAGSFDSTTQLILIFGFPLFSLITVYGVLSQLKQR